MEGRVIRSLVFKEDPVKIYVYLPDSWFYCFWWEKKKYKVIVDGAGIGEIWAFICDGGMQRNLKWTNRYGSGLYELDITYRGSLNKKIRKIAKKRADHCSRRFNLLHIEYPHSYDTLKRNLKLRDRVGAR